MEAWARKAYIGGSNEQTVVMNANALGGISTLDDVVEMIEGYRSENGVSVKTKEG